MRAAGHLFAAVLALSACMSVPVAPSATATATPEPAGDVAALFAKQRTAVAARDRAGFDSTYDRSRGSFTRCQGDLYDVAVRTGLRLAPADVVRTEPYGAYTRAFVRIGDAVRRYYVRRIDGELRLTEPAPNEIGTSKVRTVEDARIEYWEIDDDVVDAVAEAVRRARDFATAQLPVPVTKAFTVRLFPVRALAGQQCGTSASASVADVNAPFIVVYGVSLGPTLTASSSDLDLALRHEALHWVQGQTIGTRVLGLEWWLLEGWPDRIAGVDRSRAFKTFDCVQGPPPMAQLMEVRTALDEPFTTDEASRSYAAANTMIEFLAAQHGADAHWRLVRALAEVADPAPAYTSVLGTSKSAFYDAWAAWSHTRYC